MGPTCRASHERTTTLQSLHTPADSADGSASAVSARKRRPSRAQRRRSWRERKRELYARRKDSGKCTRCPSLDLAPDSLMCAGCLTYAKTQTKASTKRGRKARRKAGLCAHCGLVRSETYECPGCRERLGRQEPIQNVNRNVNLHHAPALAIGGSSRPTAPLEWVTEANGERHQRYRGQGRKGPPSKLQTLEWSLRAIEAEVSRARCDFATYYSDENGKLPKLQRDASRHAARGHLTLALRFAAEALGVDEETVAQIADLVERGGKGLR